MGPYEGGGQLFRTGDRDRALYAVRSGSVKTFVIDRAGREQVLGFHLTGEVLGLDAVCVPHHQCNAAALEASRFCKIAYRDLARWAREYPSLQTELMRLMSRELSSHIPIFAPHGTKGRLAAFLFNLYERTRLQDGPRNRLQLPMSREDIADYLGVAPETISRVLSGLQTEGVIEVRRKVICLLHVGKLRTLAAGE